MSSDDATPTDRHGLDVLDMEESLTLLRSRPIGRFAYLAAGEPVVVPANYLVDGATVVLRSLAGSKLDAAVIGEAVSLQIDDFDIEERTGWSVLVRGTAQLVDSGEDIARYDTELESWAVVTPGSATWIRIVATDISGRRLRKR